MRLWFRAVAIAAAAAVLLGGAHAELTLSIYGNSAMHGEPEVQKDIPDLDVGLPLDRAYSAEVVGQLVYDADSFFAFECIFTRAQIAIVWVDDHLVCHTDPPFSTAVGTSDGTPMYPLRGAKGKAVPLVIHVYSNLTSATHSQELGVNVRWIHLAASVPQARAPASEAVPASSLLPSLPPLELRRRALQQSTKQGWNAWSYNLLNVVKLPESCSVTIGLCELSTGKCLLDTFIEDQNAKVRVGMFATDFSYWQFYLGFQGINVSMSYSGGEHLTILAEPVNCGRGPGGANCSDFVVVVMPSYKWERVGGVSIAQDKSSITYSPLGLGEVELRLTHRSSNLSLRLAAVGAGALVLPLDQGAVGLQDSVHSGQAPPSVDELRSFVEDARRREIARIGAFTGDVEGGDRFATKEALQAATMWNLIYTPTEYGPVFPVSRSWNFVEKPLSKDWQYVIFDWDNIFASYMSSYDPTSKDFAYSNFIQVIRSRTAKGFVPNYAAAGKKSLDRTEPPIGAKVLLEMYKKCKDAWLVELLFDDLLGWSDWFLRERILQPSGLVALGSDFIAGNTDGSTNHMQGARFESGLDNSPMYDGEFFDNQTHLMGLYDVGMSSMFVQEAASLAALAKAIGRPDAEAKRLSDRAEAMRRLISENLWDPVGEIFTNRFPNGTFYRRISPTSFYSMLAEAATDEQAASMASQWLMSPKHFCIAPAGDFAGNSDSCYWGLPSIQAEDVAFPPLGYWRGYVWGPMAMLTYWSLQQYDHVAEVRQGRKALCKQMNQLMLWQWRKNRHICENYSPHRTADDHAGDCSGTKFYHWGALTGMISLLEQGLHGSSADGDIVLV